MARVLQPGGRLIVGELGRWSSWAATRRIRAWLGAAIWSDARFQTARGLRHLAERTGLEVETIRGAIFYPRLATLARWLSIADGWLGRHGTLGAAFLGMSAVKKSR